MIKRKYLKPEIKTVFLRLASFVAVSGGNETQHQWEGNPLNPGGGEGTDPENNDNNSRYLRGNMWDDMN